MPVIGYSDRINHAFAYAAKHHDQQVRKGTRLPYLTHPANVAVILTRYGRDEETVVAGILHDVIEDCVREGWSVEKLEERIGSKFGNSVVNTALSVAERRIDDDGVELSIDDRNSDCLTRLALATEDALWVSAAHNLHNVNSVLSDLRRTSFPETVWGRFAAGREGTVRRYVKFSDRLQEIGFHGAIADEL
ncbi:MAG: HD domain-containing protein, partial [Gemmatimonadaceae bacterium]